MGALLGETEVCVIGGGMMGLCAAYQMARRSLDVVLLERSQPGLESSAANAGTLGIQNKPLAAVPLVLRAIDMWRRFGDESGEDIEYERRGGFRLAHTEEDVRRLQQAVRAQQALGVDSEMVYQPELSRAAPYLDSAIPAASFCADDGMANPLASVRAMVRAVSSRGVRLWPQSAVIGIDARGDHDFVVRTGRGDLRCSTIVAAAGAWTGAVAGLVGVRLPITADVLQVLTTDLAPPIFPHILTHIRGNLTMKQARATGKVLIGGAWRGHGDPESGVKRVRRDSLMGNLAWACQNVPGLARTSLLRAWVGFEGRTPDKLLVCGSVGAPRGFHVLGCAAGGYTIAPMAGIIAAQHVVGEPTDLECSPFHVQRLLGAAA